MGWLRHQVFVRCENRRSATTRAGQDTWTSIVVICAVAKPCSPAGCCCSLPQPHRSRHRCFHSVGVIPQSGFTDSLVPVAILDPLFKNHICYSATTTAMSSTVLLFPPPPVCCPGNRSSLPTERREIRQRDGTVEAFNGL